MDLSTDKLWHHGLMYKPKLLGICGKHYRLTHSFPNNRHQRVVLNGQCSNWSIIKAGITQGSILFFSIYINNLPEAFTANAKFFSDDTPLFSVFHDSTSSSKFLNRITSGK